MNIENTRQENIGPFDDGELLYVSLRDQGTQLMVVWRDRLQVKHYLPIPLAPLQLAGLKQVEIK